MLFLVVRFKNRSKYETGHKVFASRNAFRLQSALVNYCEKKASPSALGRADKNSIKRRQEITVEGATNSQLRKKIHHATYNLYQQIEEPGSARPFVRVLTIYPPFTKEIVC
jgi:hypothetical protein